MRARPMGSRWVKVRSLIRHGTVVRLPRVGRATLRCQCDDRSSGRPSTPCPLRQRARCTPAPSTRDGGAARHEGHPAGHPLDALPTFAVTVTSPALSAPLSSGDDRHCWRSSPVVLTVEHPHHHAERRERSRGVRHCSDTLRLGQVDLAVEPERVAVAVRGEDVAARLGAMTQPRLRLDRRPRCARSSATGRRR